MLKDRRIVVITGVTRGLGQAMAEGFIAAGHTVLGCGRYRPAIDELCASFTTKEGHEFSVVDVADAVRVEEWAAQMIAGWGVPDILVNNAAIINQNAPLWEVPANEFSMVIDINIKGTANTIRAFVPAMIKKGSGVIVNFSSGWGRSAAPDVTPYCTSKWAIEGLTKAFAQELPRGMAAVALSPGVVDTQMLRSCLPVMAPACPSPEQWAAQAIPYILNLGPQHNGQSLSIS